MKKYILYILIFTGSFGLFSCNNFLDVDQYFNDLNQFDSVFNSRNTAEQWLWETYSYLEGTGADISNKANQAFNFASDDLIYGDRTNTNGGCRAYQNCEYGPSKMLYEDRWGHWYRGIRSASIFIHNIDKCLEMQKKEVEDYKAQARFLRAYFYWKLMQQWGPVPILPSEGQEVNLSYEELSIPRASYDECVEFVVSEFEQAAIHLPLERTVAWLGMITKGAALAARAKVLLYAASPLYNGNKELFNLKDKDGRQLINQTPDNKKWARAAAAAEEVINLGIYELYTVKDDPATTVYPPAELCQNQFPDGCGGIDPYLSYRNLFNGAVRAKDNPELIFFRQNYSGEDINEMVKHSYPNKLGGWNTNAVTLKQVDAYYMFDGRDKDSSSEKYKYEESGYADLSTNYAFVHRSDEPREQVCRRFCNREPRFYASIAFHGCIWESLNATDGKDGMYLVNRPCDYYKGGRDGKILSSPEFFLRTGLGLFKYYNPDDTWQAGSTYVTYKVEPAIRYADVLLWYAEAANEIEGGKEYTFDTYDKNGTIVAKRDVVKMQKAFSRVRFRAGLPDATDYNDAAQFRKTLKRERQIELFAEASRYFDLRRWMDAPVEEAQPIMGMNVDMSLSRRDEFYKPVPSDMKKVWLDKMYLWPIPKNETDRNVKLTQNPGW